MNIISDILFIISNGLMIPVMLLLIYFLIRGVIMIVELFPLYRRRRAERKALEAILTSGEVTPRLSEIEKVADAPLRRLIESLDNHRNDTPYCEREINSFEIDAKSELSRSKSLIKFGPMLGLMGTLIPMGPALVGLASGDLGAMAYNMQVAFATTVVGMLIASFGVLTLHINRNYYSRTLNDIDYIYSKLAENE